ncbi:RICIN domain-containing protein [Kitasatospora sp. NPDC058406]|uniref:RICIN domain-containing protein n=1 Tax=Kitasatospora sp. NPDC058406 TaxID=3346483 RepID=UPI00365C39A3
MPGRIAAPAPDEGRGPRHGAPTGRTTPGRAFTSLVAALALLAGSAALFPALSAAAPAADPAQAPYDLAHDAPVLIVLGQSNAGGWVAPITDAADVTQCRSLSHVRGLNRTNNQQAGMTQATWSPYTCSGSNLGEEHNHGLNYSVASATALRWERAVKAGAALPDLHVIHLAWGSQGVQGNEPTRNKWWPDRNPADAESLFPRAVNTIANGLRALREAGRQPRVVGIHWNQWEAEAANTATVGAGQVRQALLDVLEPLRTITGAPTAPVFLYRPRAGIYDATRTRYVTEAVTAIAGGPAPNPYRLLDAADATSATGTPLYRPTEPPNFGIFGDGVHYTRAVQEWYTEQQWKTVFTDRQYGTPVRATVNAALGKPATQSSTNRVGVEEAGNAVDGNTSGVYAQATPSYTKNEAQAWWQVDLGAKQPIRSVELFNRTDWSFERLTDFDVIVSATDLTGRSWADIQADPAVRKTRIKGTAPTKLTVAVGADGRYVRIQLAGTDHLTLPEVQVNVPVATVPGGYRTVTLAGTSHVIDVRAGSVADHAQIIRYPNVGSSNQRFAFRPLADGHVRIVNERSGKDLTVDNASRAAGAKIVQRTYTTGGPTDDEWRPEDAGNGRVRLANRHSGLYLTAGATETAQFEQHPYHGNDLQVFVIG